MRRFGAVLTAVACFAAFGCGDDDDNGGGGGGGGNGGGSSAEETEVREALTAYARAIADNDPAEACTHMTESAAEDAKEEVPGSDSCEDSHRTILAAIGDKRGDLADQLADVDFEVAIEGDTAELTAPSKPGADALKMRKEGGEWKLDQNTLTFNPTGGE
jgi:hypothetical protein